MRWDALEAVIRRVRLSMEQDIRADRLVADEIIRDCGLVPDWSPGTYEAGEVRNHDGQTWRCCQAHDSTENDAWSPGAAAALWAPYHATDPRYARPFLPPTGSHDAYRKGEVMVWTDGKTYRSTMDANVYDPEGYPQGWEAIA